MPTGRHRRLASARLAARLAALLAAAAATVAACGPATPAPAGPGGPGHHGGPTGQTGTGTGTGGTGADTSNAGATTPAYASIERTACLGWCPVYRVIVHDDGTLLYHGEAWVMTPGDVRAQVTDEQLLALDAAFAEAGFDALADSYENRTVTDQPTVILSYKGKAVRHYRGDRSAPPALVTLQNRVDEILRTEQWIGTEAERERLWRGRNPR